MQSLSRKVKFSDFIGYMFQNWQQGEHISIIGPTGRGKTELALQLCRMRRYLVIFGTKTEDSTLGNFIKYDTVERVKEFKPDLYFSTRYAVWPSFTKIEDINKQRKVFSDAFARIYTQGNWTLYIDETYYFSKMLGLEQYLNMYWTQARSNGISVVGATQRPRNVPLLMFDQATHVMMFKVQDDYARKRLAEIGGLNNKDLGSALDALGSHDFLYVNMIDGTMLQSNVRS